MCAIDDSMLIELKVKNFMSFKEETIFSMERSSIDKDKLINNFTKINELNIPKSSIILGANASGKSNLLLALDFIKWLLKSSRTFEKKQKIKYFPFKLDSNYREEKPISFQIKFISNNNIYAYDISLRKNIKKTSEYGFKIISEKLEKNNVLIYNRREKNKFEFNPSVSDETRITSTILYENALLLSTSAIKKTEKSLEEAYQWFDEILEVNMGGLLSKEATIDNYNKNPKFKTYLMNYLKKADLGNITDLKIKKRKFTFPKDLPEDIIQEFLKENKYIIETYHLDEKKENIKFDFDMEESNGTKKFTYLLGYIYNLINQNKVLIIDELENGLHPELLKLIFQIIHKTDCKAQLISTTHSYSLLQYVNSDNDEVFRRDQIWFARKKKDMSTQLYSLVNIGGIRKDLRIWKAYFEGRLEAFPNIKFE